jgi:hypothetical protein
MFITELAASFDVARLRSAAISVSIAGPEGVAFSSTCVDFEYKRTIGKANVGIKKIQNWHRPISLID